MISINIHEAKTQLSKYLAKLRPGESILICKRNVPIAELRALPQQNRKPRPIGLAKGAGKLRLERPPFLQGRVLPLWQSSRAEGERQDAAGGLRDDVPRELRGSVLSIAEDDGYLDGPGAGEVKGARPSRLAMMRSRSMWKASLTSSTRWLPRPRNQPATSAMLA